MGKRRRQQLQERGDSVSSEETPLLDDTVTQVQRPAKKAPVSWASLPRKGQLAVLVLARLAEPLSERSLSSYLFHQLQWFDPGLGQAEIAKQAGYMTAVFAAAQCLTSMWWGRAADSPLLGRKRVLMIGLMGTALSALGIGFSTSLPMALFFRFTAGALNGNIGVLRTMVSEIVADKRHQPRAFLLLPMCFNVGVIIGPLLSGFLADPVHSMPTIVGPGSFLGGKDGIQWMIRFPYAPPNLFSGSILLTAALLVAFGLDETHPALCHRRDRCRQLGKRAMAILTGQAAHIDEPEAETLLASPSDTERAPISNPKKEYRSSSLREILTRNVCMTMVQRLVQTLHVSAFNSMLFTLLPAPRAEKDSFHLPFHFSGGLGLSSQQVGFANTTIGIIGIPLQLIVYPMLIGKMGVRSSYRLFLPLSIVAYMALPYLIVLPEAPALVWTCLALVLSIQVTSRTFVNPATLMLVNDAAPRPDLLGTVHGVASSISSAGRIVAPTIGGYCLGWGLSHDLVVAPLWFLGILAMANWVVLFWVDEVKM